ncbi:hypothetical protein ACFX2I_027343 [Malus domestica]
MESHLKTYYLRVEDEAESDEEPEHSSTNTARASDTNTRTLSTYADLSTMFEPKSAINSTSGFMIPDCTALILFSLTEQIEYIAVDASFFPRKPPYSRRFTSSGIAPDRPIATLFSSICERGSRAQEQRQREQQHALAVG